MCYLKNKTQEINNVRIIHVFLAQSFVKKRILEACDTWNQNKKLIYFNLQMIWTKFLNC